jgi:uncharacterized membrane protein
LLAAYVQDFSHMLTMVPLKNEYVWKLIFLYVLMPWVQKIVYQRIDISKMCQGLMKMVECMENETHVCPKGEIGSKVT